MICDSITLEAPPANPLKVVGCTLFRYPEGDISDDKLGLQAKITLSGDYTGTLYISWGNGIVEKKYSQSAGYRIYQITLPAGETKVCAYIDGQSPAVCDQITLKPTSTMTITSLNVVEFPEGNDASAGLVGVQANIMLEGTGTGNLKIQWGDITTETIPVSPGLLDIGNSLPPGTHNICVELV